MKKILAAIALVISLTSGGLVGSSQALSAGTDCPSGTTFVAKYETSNTMIRFAEGADVITFSDKVANTDGELVRFDFSSTTPISFVFVKAGSDPDDSRSSDFRTRSVTTGNDLGTIKGISHISFCGPAVVTLATPTPSATPTPTPTPTPTATPIVIQIIPTPTPTVVTQVIPTPTPTPTIVSSPTPSPVVTSTPTPAVAGVQQPAIIGMVNPAVDQQPAAQAMVVPNSQQQSVAAQAAAPAGPAAQGTISGLPSSSTVAQAASGMPFGAMLLATGVFLLRRRRS